MRTAESRPAFSAAPRRGILALAALVSTATALAPSVLAPPAAIAAPEPDPIPRRWELRVEPSDLRLTSVDVPGVGPRAFFYLTYTVTNSSGEDRDFHPAFELTNESGRVYRSGRGVAPEVVDELLRRVDGEEGAPGAGPHGVARAARRQ